MNIIGLTPTLLLNLVAFLLIPLPITVYLFKRFKLNLLELIPLTLILSTSFLPITQWLFNLILPFGYLSLMLTLIIPAIISGYLLFSKRVILDDFKFAPSKSSILIFLLFVGAFYFHIQSLSSFFYEFDPYYYSFINWYLLKDGSVPTDTNWAYIPPQDITHNGEVYPTHSLSFRTLYVPQYLGAMWHLIGFGNSNIDHYLVKYMADLYPPLAFGLMIFAVYFFLKDNYSPWIAVGAAVIMMFMPYLSQKFLAGVSEQLPWGLYIGITSVVFLYYGFKYGEKDWRMYVPALITVMGALFGSKAGMIPLVIAGGYGIAHTSIEFMFNRRHKSNYELNFVLLCFGVLLMILYEFWVGGQMFSLGRYLSLMVSLIGGLYSLLIYHLMERYPSKLKTMANRGLVIGFLGLFVILFLLSPLGSPISSYLMVLSKVGTLEDTGALQKTVAEESLGGSGLSDRVGIAGISLPITKVSQLLFGKYGALNIMPLIYLLLIFTAILSIFLRSDSSLIIIGALLVLSLSFVGLQKIKYLPHLGSVLALSFGLVAGELYYLYMKKDKLIKPQSWAYYSLYFLIAVFLLVYAVYPFFSYTIGTLDYFIGKGGVHGVKVANTVTYVLMALALGLIAYGVYYFGFKVENKRYDVSLGLVLVLIILPQAINYTALIPPSVEYLTVNGTDYGEVSQFCGSHFNDPSLAYAQSFYCSIMPPYWYNAMMWVKDNMEDDKYLMSWWDYGHWTNFYARKRTLTRNDHPFVILDLEVADKYVANTPETLAEYMRAHNSTHILFDIDLIGKWGALTYLSCVYNGNTSASELPYESKCAASYMFERVLVPMTNNIDAVCELNGNYGRRGISNFGRDYCVLQASNNVYLGFNSYMGNDAPVYLVPQGVQNLDGQPFQVFLALYDKEHVDKAPGNGYNSVFYKAFVLGELPGFEQVYPAEGGFGIRSIRIYKLE